MKVCFLVIIASLFVMNYFSYISIENRAQFILVKAVRSFYLCSSMLVIIHLVSPKIPRWIFVTFITSTIFLVGIRCYHYNEINIEQYQLGSNLIFSAGNELYNPVQAGRFIVFILLSVSLGIIIYYYRRFLKHSHKENIYYEQMYYWVHFLIAPSLLFIFCGILVLLNIFDESISKYLFSLCSFVILLSILFRPKFLNTSQVSLIFLSIQKQSGTTISAQLFSSIFFKEFYYLDSNASLSQLAEKLDSSENSLREYLMQEYGLGINDVLNKFRVLYMLDLLKAPQNREFTIEYISQKAGFPSRTTMYRAFSKFHGGSPSDYTGKINY